MPEWETVARHEVVDLDELAQAVRQGNVAVLSAAAIGLAIVALSSGERI